MVEEFDSDDPDEPEDDEAAAAAAAAGRKSTGGLRIAGGRTDCWFSRASPALISLPVREKKKEINIITVIH